MRIASLMMVLTVAASGALAQSGPTLEGTIKVIPKPEITTGTTPACVCTMQYNPVCGRVGQSGWTTYSNACVARCAGATETKPGSC